MKLWVHCVSKLAMKKIMSTEELWAPLWVVDFPMFEHDEETDRWVAIHHPFTAPKEGHEDLLSDRPWQVFI